MILSFTVCQIKQEQHHPPHYLRTRIPPKHNAAYTCPTPSRILPASKRFNTSCYLRLLSFPSGRQSQHNSTATCTYGSYHTVTEGDQVQTTPSISGDTACCAPLRPNTSTKHALYCCLVCERTTTSINVMRHYTAPMQLHFSCADTTVSARQHQHQCDASLHRAPEQMHFSCVLPERWM
jgi:hypothetical protein